jgi:hypothetical protein
MSRLLVAFLYRLYYKFCKNADLFSENGVQVR